MNWFWLTHFRCSLLGTHAVSKEVEDMILQIPKNYKITVWCKWCDITLRAERLSGYEYRLKWRNF